MSSPRDDSRTNSVYIDAQEFLPDAAEEGTYQPAAGSSGSSSPLIQRTPEPEQDREDEDGHLDDDDEEDSEESETHHSAEPEERGRSRTIEPEETQDSSGESDDEEIVMQLDPSTGRQRATSLTRPSQVRARSTSMADRLRRQHRRMTSATRTSATGARTSSSRSSSQVGSSANSGATSGSGSSTSTKPTPIVDEKAQNELRRKIMDIQRDPTISFADKAKMIQVRTSLITPCLACS